VVFKYRGGLDLVGDGAAAVIRKIGTDRLWSHGDLEQYQAPVSDFYVDSVAGNNGNPGTSAAAAFAGLSVAAAAMSNNKKVSLARGSVWSDKLNLAAITGGKVAVHGSGAVPIIWASDVATAWTQPDAGTYPNVWYKAGWSSECVNSNFPVHVFENGSDLAAINFAGGAPSAGNLTSLNAAVVPTSLVPTTPDGTDDVYINVQGNPNTNGKEYRISKRASCVYANTVGNANFTVTGPLDLRDAPWASGALVGANNSNFSRALIRNSTNHGIFLASGSVEDVVFHGSTKRLNAGGSNYLVFFSATPGTYNGSAKRVGFLAGDNPSNGTFEDVAAFFSHNDQPGAVHTCATEQCWLVNISSMGGFRGGAHAHVGPYVKNSGAANLEAGTTPAAVPIRYGLFNGGASNVSLSSWDAVHAFENCASYDHKPLRTGNGFSSLRSAWFMSSAANIGITQPVGGGIPNLSVNYSILIAQSWNYCIDMSGLTSYTGNFNIFGSLFTGRQARFRYNGVENSAAGPTQYKLKWWQDATGQDAQSVYVLLADQAAGNQNALWLGYVEAAPGTNLATIGPAVGDFRINPLARVYDGNDTPRIGVFADGVTPITLAGPQLRWDWNLRAPSNGPPRRWPVVPETGSQGATYIANPAAWNFYP
jgi:hypothetical protein